MKVLLQIINDLVYKGFEKFGRYYSSYRGFVVNREDPQNYGRVKLNIPDITGANSYDYWAWPKGNYSGKGYGMQIIPNKGDMVWVEFEFGDPRRPIWSFGHFAKDEKPEELKDYDNFWFKTPKGQLVELDDTNGIIRITDSSGKILELNQDTISLIFDKISLGQKEKSNEPAVKGDKNADILKDITQALSDVCLAIQTYASSQAGVAATPPFTPLVAALTALNTQIATTQAKLPGFNVKIEKTKSLKVTLD